MSTSKPLSDVSCYLIAKSAGDAIAFYETAFGAEVLVRLDFPDGKLAHATLKVGDGAFMLADEHPDFGALSPQTVGGCPIQLQIQVADADAAAKRAVEAGATLVRAPKNEFHGSRQALVADPFGYRWFLSQAVEDLSAEEMTQRWTEMMGAA